MKNTNEYMPSLVVWEITLKCNLKCLHCGSSAGNARPNELSVKEGLKLCNDLAKLGFKGITLFGGEPFLCKDWYIIGKEIKDLDMKLSIVSNGFVNARKIVPMLAKIEVDSVQIGLDGASKQTHDYIRNVEGSFDKVIEFLRLSKNTGLSTGAITTITKMNFNEIMRIRDLVIKEDIDWQIQEAIPIGRCPREMVLSDREYYSLGLLIASLRKGYFSHKIFIRGAHNFGFYSKYIPMLGSSTDWKGCWAGKRILGIQSDGGIKGCLTLSDDFIEGNIRDKDILEIWHDPNTFLYNRNFKMDDLGENCRDCMHGKECKGGCTAKSESLTSSLHNDRHCFYRIEKTFFEDIGK